jgi:putative transcriptional regulator
MFRYTGCGLRNVWLQNGYTVKQTPHGNAVAVQDVDGLHAVVAKTLTRKARLTGAEFRFLRKELDLSQAALARWFGCEAQTIALWEKGRIRVPKLAAQVLRALYREHAEGNVRIREMIETQNDVDRRDHDAKKLVLFETEQGWQTKAA